MKKFLITTILSVLLLGGGVATGQAKGLNIIFTIHSSASNTFWQAVKNGFDDACGKIQANCQMIFTQTEGSVVQQLSNMETALVRKPDVLLTTIVNARALDGVVNKAIKNGVKVIAVNVYDTKDATGKAANLAFIGQNFRPAGYSLAKAMSAHFPAKGPIKVLVGISAPGQSWSETRGGGVMDFLKDFKAANPGRDISWKRIDSGTDLATTASRVGAYLNANPDTTAYFDTGFWDASVARVLKDRGVAPGKILLGGFDLVPVAIKQLQAGYIQVQVDQQPYMQGFMPVMEAYLMNKIGLAPASIDTGEALVTPDRASTLLKLSEQGLR